MQLQITNYKLRTLNEQTVHISKFEVLNPDYALGLKAKAIRRIDNDCRQVR